jgi:hypothetical protein
MAARGNRFVYTYRSVRRRGHADGRSWRWAFLFRRESQEPRPAADQHERATVEGELREAAEADIRGRLADWSTEDQKLKQAYCRAVSEKRAADASVEKETTEATAVRQKLERVETEVADLGEPELSPRARNFFLILLGIVEFPINLAVFQVWGEAMWMTVLMSLGLGVIIPLIAHFTGHRFRQQQQDRKDKALLWMAPFVALGLLTFIAFWRGEFMSVSAASQLLGVHISPVTATLLFVLLNLAFFFLALLISYQGTHPRAAEHRRLRKHASELRRQLTKEGTEAEAAVKREELAAKGLATARAQRQQTFETARQEARTLAQTYEHLVTVYRNANLAQRRSAACPPCLRLPIEPAELPHELADDAELDWSCE